MTDQEQVISAFQQALESTDISSVNDPSCVDDAAQIDALACRPAVRRVDTHISTLFICSDYVFKIKKAVNLGFLDYTDLAQRAHFCREELRLNSRTSPELYLAVMVLFYENDQLQWAEHLPDGATAVEYMVKMKRFGDQALLSDQIHLSRDLIGLVVEKVWDAHKTAPLSPAGFGGAKGLESVIQSNHRAFLAGPLAHKANELTELSLATLEKYRSLADERLAKGLVRLCHGDLHCANICLLDGQPRLFDAIEFSPDFQHIDLFYDFAFLLMDLEARGHRRAAAWALGHYFDLSGDYQAMALAPIMLSMRAAIRAHVAATTSLYTNTADETAKAWGYYQMALDYLAPVDAKLLALGGLSGSGKSRLARELSPLWGGHPAAVVLRTDAIRKQIMKVGLTDRLGPDGYTPEITAQTYDRLFKAADQLLKAGVPVVIDGVNARPEQRQAFEKLAKANGVEFEGLWVDVPLDRAIERIQGRVNNASDATAEVFKAQTQYDLGEITWPRISSAGTKDETFQIARDVLGL